MLAVFFFCSSGSAVAQQDWKQVQLAKIDARLAVGSAEELTAELQARKDWLISWKLGAMDAKPAANSSLPDKRKEPELRSEKSEQLGSLTGNSSLEDTLKTIRRFAKLNPSDAAVLQVQLQFLDDLPTRRKQHLDEIERVTVQLIELLNKTATDSTAEDRETETVVRQFARYRRARALAYRELPDVVAVRKIKDQEELNRQIEQAFNELMLDAGSERTEFVLLQIRMLRRSGHYGMALQKLEKFGSAILPKWYLKKRRDLLGELQWDLPHSEAAKIYAAEYPDEVAKEKAASNQTD